ncbi:TPA: phage tail protein [Pasteurella multocida]|uniref:phage tail-collar fiber domain-containing protein n=1 Tax=Pasteurella multocida TaxID=747 RepID=UPI0009F3E530|nr:phage tail protein [Pasteurella multocida]PNM04196.1 phage tail protein [Pasteurella multocida]HDR1111087.1 phage tail protein [Pasteurella multocida]HDR1119833.1 phage tail protein [Pasteurella multocida]HDX1153329.1 phage tail protein [Pasteurella multocida]
MAKQYYSVLTTYGSQQLATAIATRQPLNITHFAVGDGNGQAVTPNVASTALVNEVHRATISAVSRDPRNNKQVIFELTIPEDVGGFHIREMGIFDSQNKLIAYANCPESFKPTLSSGSGKIQVMRMILLVESSDAVTMKVDDTVIFVTRGQLTPKKITAESQNGVDNDGHSHEIESASTTVKGIVKLTDELDQNNSTLALTAKAGKTLAERIRQAIAMFSNYIPNSKKSSAVDSNSEDTIGTSKAVKIAYDRAVEAEKKGLPVGAIVGFHKSANPNGYLRAIGGTFNKTTYPDLYIANGNSNILPNLHRSDVGMTAYFAVDQIPEGWIAFDSIQSTVTQSSYPELYTHLVAKYGSIAQVPLAEDRFIRNAGSGLNVGETQDDAIRNIKGQITIDDYDRDKITGVFKFIGEGTAAGNKGGGTLIEFDASRVVPTADENRPKSIVLKLCIKSKNSFDDVVFWIKAFGVIENAGTLDAGTLAQDVQQIRSKTQQLESLFNQNRAETALKIQDIEERLNEESKVSKVIWSGNVTQNSTSVLELSESILNTTLVFYLQVSQGHSLQQNVDTHTMSAFIDEKLIHVSGKKYIHFAFYVGGWKSIQIEIVEDRKIKIIEASSMYLKQITKI